MSGRTVAGACLVLAVCMNSASGLAKVMGFHHRHAGELALAEADLDAAFHHLNAALMWQSGDSPTYVLIGRVIHHAQANGLPLEALDGRQPRDMLAIGLAAVTRGICLNPADAWAWFSLAEVYQGFRSSRVRYERMRRAGETAGPGAAAGMPPGQDDATEARRGSLDPEDRIGVAAALKAQEVEPEFHFYHAFLAKLYWDRGLQSEAAREIREGMTLWPRVEAYPMLESSGMLQGLSGPVLEGIERSAANQFVRPVLAALARAIVLEKLGRKEEAIAAYQALKRLGGRKIAAECDLTIGRLEIERGRHRESLPLLERVVREGAGGPHEASALHYLGLAHSSLGDHGKAADSFRRYLALVPDSLWGFVLLAGAEERLGRSAVAEELLVAAVRRFPREPYAYLAAIDHLRTHGKAPEALVYAQALRKIGPDREGAERLILELETEASRRP